MHRRTRLSALLAITALLFGTTGMLTVTDPAAAKGKPDRATHRPAAPPGKGQQDRDPQVPDATPLSAASGKEKSPGKAKKRVVWRDDFTGKAGTKASSRWWTYQTGGEGWGNEELQRYTSDAANASLDGLGNLAVTARPDNTGTQCWYGTCRYTSARLTTSGKVTAKYGRVEARMKLPDGQGLWPAFWMLGANYFTVGHPASGEIDIMELVGSEPSRVWGSVHGPGYTGLSSFSELPDGSRFADAFHVFALDWSPTELVFSVDDVVYHRVTRADLNGAQWVFDQPFFIILNLAVGGRWPGEPTPDTTFPATMLVDYVAIYR